MPLHHCMHPDCRMLPGLPSRTENYLTLSLENFGSFFHVRVGYTNRRECRLIERGYERAALFSWERSVRAIHETYMSVIDVGPKEGPKRATH